MSKIQTNQIQHTQNGAAVFTLPTSDGSANQVIKTDGSGNLSFATDAGGKFASYAVIADQKSSGTVSGTFVSGAWRVRDLNTELADADGIVSISSNQFTLQAGTYLIKWSCPAYGRSYHASRLRNNTDGINYSGASVYSDYNSNVQNTSIGAARLTIGAAKVFEIQHRCDNSSSGENTAFGVRVGNAFTVDYEIYTICEIYKEV
tara:strand:- start:1885 stop:2496 length:612 start_codon:yes stop_codon:yes gene_type:complete